MAGGQPNRTSGKRQSASAREGGLGCTRQGPSTRLGTNGEQVSRRAVLGAAVGLPLAIGDRHRIPIVPSVAQQTEGEFGASPQLQPPAAEAWARALAAFEAAAGEVRAFEAHCSGRGFEEQEALQGGYDALGEAMDSALLRLLRAPAPDVAALAVKIGLAIDHEIGTLSGGAACLAAIRRDAVRLSTAGMGTVR